MTDNHNNPCFCNLNRKNYKLIFMDCNMPIMDGFQATVEIKQLLRSDRENNHKIFIIALTAYTTDNFRTKSVEAGMDAFVTKPLHSD